MPFPNFHACRLRDPGDFDQFRVDKQKRVQMIVGHLKDGGGWTAQSVRYPTEDWTEGEARKSCQEHKGISFEPAASAESSHEMNVKPVEHEISADQFESLWTGDVLVFELATETLTGVPIFAAGTWTDSAGRKKTFTIPDLDEMVVNFKTLADKIKPYLKLMHLRPEDHRRVTAAPALGWITTLRRNGTKLIADFGRVPKTIAELIRVGTYRRISAEIFHRYRDESSGKIYKNVVSAAGLLGAKHPAVNTLDDVMKLFGMSASDAVDVESVSTEEWAECYGDSEPIAAGFYEATYSEHADSKSSQPKEDDMDEKEVQALIDKAVKPIEKAAAEFESGIRSALGIEKDKDVLAEILGLKTENAAKGQAILDNETREFESQLEATILDAKKAGKLAPAQEHAVKIMVEAWKAQTDDSGKFSLKVSDETTVNGSVIECLKGYFEAMPKQFNIDDEKGGQGVDKKNANAVVPIDVAQFAKSDPGLRGEHGPRYCSVALDKEIRAYAREYKVDYIEAMEEVTGVERPIEPDLSMHSMRKLEEV